MPTRVLTSPPFSTSIPTRLITSPPFFFFVTTRIAVSPPSFNFITTKVIASPPSLLQSPPPSSSSPSTPHPPIPNNYITTLLFLGSHQGDHWYFRPPCHLLARKSVPSVLVPMTRGQYHGGRRPSSDDSFHSPTVTPPSALDKPSIMKRYHRRRTCSHTSPRRSPPMVTLHDTRFVECRWWNDGRTVKTVVTWRSSASMIPAPGA